ncbi:MAG: hypothetical protein KDK51_00520 [Deltaproteobacteria bacterium]|nr:hypothetical protein [Deltaproteobacteria bacterium]
MKKLLTLILILALQACGGLSLLDPATRSDSSSQVPQNDTPDPDNIPESPIYQDPTPLSPPDLCDGGVDYKNAPKDIFIVMPETVRVKGAPYVSSRMFTVHAPTPGYRDLWFQKASESGPSQPDEHTILLIKNTTNPDGYPVNPNAAPYFVMIDNDNALTSPIPQEPQYAGRFWFDAGDQDIIAIHYCQIYEELVNANNGSEDPNNIFFSFHNGTCTDVWSRFNSIHFGTDHSVCSQ